MNDQTLMIKGLISEQPQEVQAVINEAYAQLKATVEAAEEAHEGAGNIALALLGTERSE